MTPLTPEKYEVITPDRRIVTVDEDQVPYFLLELYGDNAVKAVVARGLLGKGQVIRYRNFEVKQLYKEEKNAKR